MSEYKTPNPGRLLVGSILAIASSVLFVCWYATQWVAQMLGYQPELGAPWWHWGMTPVYAPWKFFVWAYFFEPYAPRQFNKGWLVVYGGALLTIVAAFLLALLRARRRPVSTTHGSARWATPEEIRSSGLLDGKGVVLGLSENGDYLRHDGPEHILTMAPTRSGKGVGIVIPTLLTWPHSVLINDIKGENWDITAGYRARFTLCMIFNPTEAPTQHFKTGDRAARFNPLNEIRMGEFEVKDAQNIADMIVDPDGKGMSDHWAKTGHALLVGTILHVMYCERDKTMAGVAAFLSDPSRPFELTLNHMLQAIHDPELNRGWRDREGQATATHPVIASAARELLNKSENERSGVLSTAMSFLSLYRDPIIARNTAESDFTVADLLQSERPISLYIVVPPSDISRTRPLTRLLLNLVIRRLTERLAPTENKHRLLLLIDEFPALGRMDIFESALAYIAGYGLKALLIIQSNNQLKKTYGPQNSIIDNCHIRTVYTPNDKETAKDISDMLGKKTEVYQQTNYSGHRLSPWLGHVMKSDQETGRELLTPEEVQKFPADDEIVFVTGLPAIRAKKLKYYADDNFKRRLMPAPNVGQAKDYPYRPAPRIVSAWPVYQVPVAAAATTQAVMPAPTMEPVLTSVSAPLDLPQAAEFSLESIFSGTAFAVEATGGLTPAQLEDQAPHDPHNDAGSAGHDIEI